MSSYQEGISVTTPSQAHDAQSGEEQLQETGRKERKRHRKKNSRQGLWKNDFPGMNVASCK